MMTLNPRKIFQQKLISPDAINDHRLGRIVAITCSAAMFILLSAMA